MKVFAALLLLLLVFVNDAWGTIILLNFKRERAIVATDSRGRLDSDIDDNACKLVQVDPQTFFFAYGGTSITDTATKREVWSLHSVAQEVFKQRSDPSWDGFIRLIAKWTDLVRARYQSLLDKQGMRLERNRQLISVGTFGRSFETSVRLYQVSFNYPLPPEVAQPIVKPSSLEIFPNDQSPIVSAGNPLAIPFANEFIDNKTQRAIAANQIFDQQFKNRLESHYEAQRLRSAIMFAIHWIPDKIIGGKVDSLILEKNRTIEWISKKDCSNRTLSERRRVQ